MAKFKALKTFSGAISMRKGSEKEITDEAIAKDLLEAGFVIALDSEKVTAKKPAKKTSKKDEDGDLNG